MNKPCQIGWILLLALLAAPAAPALAQVREQRICRLPAVESTKPKIIQLREILVPLCCRRLKLPSNPVLRSTQAVELAKHAVATCDTHRVRTLGVVTKLHAPRAASATGSDSCRVEFDLPTSGYVHVPFIGDEGLGKYRVSVPPETIARMEIGDRVTLEVRLLRSSDYRIKVKHLDIIGEDGSSLLMTKHEADSRRPTGTR